MNGGETGQREKGQRIERVRGRCMVFLHFCNPDLPFSFALFSRKTWRRTL
jgi:hypothetical protein